MPQDISQKHPKPHIARTSNGNLLALRLVDEAVRVADVFVIEREGERQLARGVGRLESVAPLRSEAEFVEAYRFSPYGQPIGEVVGNLPAPDQGGHDWGALGLPEGLETRVVPLDDPTEDDELAIARASKGSVELERDPMLTIAPGERLTLGDRTGIVIAVDRRNGTIGVDLGEGEPVTLSLDSLDDIDQ